MAFDLRQGIIETANAIGMTPEDLATIIHYESGFNPDVWGGAGGKHYGAIQFGPAERAKYGVVVGDPSSQFGANGAIARYFKDRGYRPGMSFADAYSTVNAGSPGRYNASDAGSGGQPGNVMDKVQNQMADDRAKAQAFLGETASGSYDPRRDTPSYGRPTGEAVSQYALAHPVGPEGDDVTTSPANIEGNPYALPSGAGTEASPLITEEKERPWNEKLGEGIAGGLGKITGKFGYDVPNPVPGGLARSTPTPMIDPAQSQNQRMALAYALQRLNAGKLA
jgi:hypothetical protein